MADALSPRSTSSSFRFGLAGLLIVTGTACGAARPNPSRQHVLDCLRANGWTPTSHPRPNAVILEAGDGHAELELLFWESEAAARHAIPDLAPVGVGWSGNVSWRSTIGFTYADEQTLDRCLPAEHRGASALRDGARQTRHTVRRAPRTRSSSRIAGCRAPVSSHRRSHRH